MTASRRVLMVTLTAGLLGAPIAANPQQAVKVYRIGVLAPAAPTTRLAMTVGAGLFLGRHEALDDRARRRARQLSPDTREVP